MVVLFSDFYIKTYITAPKLKEKLKEQTETNGVHPSSYGST